MSTPKALISVKSVFENLDYKNLDKLDSVYHLSCRFQDPVVLLNSRDELKRHLHHQYSGAQYARFRYTGDIVDLESKQAVIQWEMDFAHNYLNRGREITTPGVSVLQWNDDELITFHRDHYDVSQMLFEQIPLVGGLFSKLKARLAARD